MSLEKREGNGTQRPVGVVSVRDEFCAIGTGMLPVLSCGTPWRTTRYGDPDAEQSAFAAATLSIDKPVFGQFMSLKTYARCLRESIGGVRHAAGMPLAIRSALDRRGACVVTNPGVPMRRDRTAEAVVAKTKHTLIYLDS